MATILENLSWLYSGKGKVSLPQFTIVPESRPSQIMASVSVPRISGNFGTLAICTWLASNLLIVATPKDNPIIAVIPTKRTFGSSGSRPSYVWLWGLSEVVPESKPTQITASVSVPHISGNFGTWQGYNWTLNNDLTLPHPLISTGNFFFLF